MVRTLGIPNREDTPDRKGVLAAPDSRGRGEGWGWYLPDSQAQGAFQGERAESPPEGERVPQGRQYRESYSEVGLRRFGGLGRSGQA